MNSQKTSRKGRPYGCGLKLNQGQARDIKRLYYTTKTSLRKLAKQFGVSHQNIFLIVNGNIWVPLNTKETDMENINDNDDGLDVCDKEIKKAKVVNGKRICGCGKKMQKSRYYQCVDCKPELPDDIEFIYS